MASKTHPVLSELNGMDMIEGCLKHNIRYCGACRGSSDPIRFMSGGMDEGWQGGLSRKAITSFED